MRARIAATASVLALLAGPVIFAGAQAQTTAPPSSNPPGSLSAPSAAVPRAPMPDPMTMEDVTQIKGSTVYGSDDKKIGGVAAVLMDPQSKKIDRLVVSEGGLLGVGSHHVALPVSDFKWDGMKDGFKISKTADELKAMPEWKSASSASATTPAAPSGSSLPAPRAPAGTGTAGTGTSGTGTSGTGTSGTGTSGTGTGTTQ